MSFIIGLIMTVAGALITIKSEAVFGFFGRIEFFEEKLASSGGSRLGYKLFGLLLFFLGVLTMTGLITGFMEFILSPLLKYSNPDLS
ncbi:MAG: hypothetical protein NTY12_00800 [Candidatus Falkowbacteria bacterium]|nr:hypothetical protein [Candidatus Falkowbacteria bacterium]